MQSVSDDDVRVSLYFE